jgi:hypothetical protein
MDANRNDDNEPGWRNSEAKKVLLQFIECGDIPRDGSMPPKIVWNAFCLPRREFLRFTYKRFPPRLRSLLDSYNECVLHSARDFAAMINDRLLFPPVATRKPLWEGSEGQRLLKLDVDEKKHETMTPKQLYQTRPEYFEHNTLLVFRNHIYQEVRLRKFVRQYYSGTR